jgi:hypothetical protein
MRSTYALSCSTTSASVRRRVGASGAGAGARPTRRIRGGVPLSKKTVSRAQDSVRPDCTSAVTSVARVASTLRIEKSPKKPRSLESRLTRSSTGTPFGPSTTNRCSTKPRRVALSPAFITRANSRTVCSAVVLAADVGCCAVRGMIRVAARRTRVVATVRRMISVKGGSGRRYGWVCSSACQPTT